MIYIVLTTTPDRIDNKSTASVNLYSLLNQESVDDFRVVLSIPTKYKNYDNVHIPEWLTDLLSTTDKLILLRDDIDHGPITNLVYPLKQLKLDPDDILIVCDDDHEYQPTMVSTHIQLLKKYPINHAICFRGNGVMELRSWEENGKRFAKFWGTHVYFPADRDVYLKLPDHWHSVSYRRRFFKDDFFDDAFLNKTWNNDHLLGWYAMKHNFYFICPYVHDNHDMRPVNDNGRGSYSYPIKRSLSIEAGGCHYYRQTPYDSSFVDTVHSYNHGIFELDAFFSENEL
jgi:hypothetical protein